MLPTPSWHELARRLPRLIVGLVLFGIGVAMMVLAELGLSPWEVMSQGISFNTGIPIGTVGILIGIVVLLLWIPLKEKVGIGTIFNVILIGIVVDLTLWALPATIDEMWLRWVMMLGGTIVIAFGSGLYIGVGLGPGLAVGAAAVLLAPRATAVAAVGAMFRGISLTIDRIDPVPQASEAA